MKSGGNLMLELSSLDLIKEKTSVQLEFREIGNILVIFKFSDNFEFNDKFQTFLISLNTYPFLNP